MIPNKKGDSGMAHHLDFSKIRVKKKEYNEDGTVKPRVYAFTSDWTFKYFMSSLGIGKN